MHYLWFILHSTSQNFLKQVFRVYILSVYFKIISNCLVRDTSRFHGQGFQDTGKKKS